MIGLETLAATLYMSAHNPFISESNRIPPPLKNEYANQITLYCERRPINETAPPPYFELIHIQPSNTPKGSVAKLHAGKPSAIRMYQLQKKPKRNNFIPQTYNSKRSKRYSPFSV